MDPDSCMTEFVQFIEFIEFDENPFILEKLEWRSTKTHAQADFLILIRVVLELWDAPRQQNSLNITGKKLVRSEDHSNHDLTKTPTDLAGGGAS